MIPLHHDPCFTFRFADDRIISRFHLEGVEAGRRVSVFKIDPGAGERLGLLATATVGDGGWVDLPEPIIVRAGDAFIAVPGQSSATPPLTLLGVGGRFAVCKLPPDSAVPTWGMAGDVFSVTRTVEELSVVCRQEMVPSGTKAEVGCAACGWPGRCRSHSSACWPRSRSRWRLRASASSSSRRSTPITCSSRRPSFRRQLQPCGEPVTRSRGYCRDHRRVRLAPSGSAVRPAPHGRQATRHGIEPHRGHDPTNRGRIRLALGEGTDRSGDHRQGRPGRRGDRRDHLLLHNGRAGSRRLLDRPGVLGMGIASQAPTCCCGKLSNVRWSPPPQPATGLRSGYSRMRLRRGASSPLARQRPIPGVRRSHPRAAVTAGLRRTKN